MMKRAAVLLAATGLLLSGAVPTAAQTPATIRVIGASNDGMTAVYYGVKSGIFKKYGLDVQPSVVQSGSAAAAALSGGSADVAATTTLAVIEAHVANIPLQYITPGASVSAAGSFSAALVSADSPIKTARDVNGKTIGTVSLKDVNAAAFLAWVDQNGGDSKTVKQLEMPASAAVQMLDAKRADIVLLTQPAVGQALASGKARVLVNPYEAFPNPVDPAGFAALAPTINANREAYARFAQALHEASVYTNAHPAETVDLLASFSGATPDQIARSARIVIQDYLDPRRLQPLVDLCAKYGIIAKTFPAADIISPVALKPTR